MLSILGNQSKIKFRKTLHYLLFSYVTPLTKVVLCVILTIVRVKIIFGVWHSLRRLRPPPVAD